MTPYAQSTFKPGGDKLPGVDSMGPNENHGGSRKRLLFIRKQRTVEGNQFLLDAADALHSPLHNTRRSNLITNIDIENGR